MTKPTKWFMGMPFQAEGLNFRHFEKKRLFRIPPSQASGTFATTRQELVEFLLHSKCLLLQYLLGIYPALLGVLDLLYGNLFKVLTPVYGRSVAKVPLVI